MRAALAMQLSVNELVCSEPIMTKRRAASGDEGFSVARSEGRSMSQDVGLAAVLDLRMETGEKPRVDVVPHAAADDHDQ